MIRMTVLAVGNLKESYWREAAGEYQKRLSRFCRLELKQVAEERAPESLSPAQEQQVMEKEGERLLRAVAENAFVIALTVDGRRLSSPELAEFVQARMTEGKSHICWIIGGSLGLSPAVRRRADYCLSLSELTMPHQLCRVFLLEQIYRVFKILAGETYHK